MVWELKAQSVEVTPAKTPTPTPTSAPVADLLDGYPFVSMAEVYARLCAQEEGKQKWTEPTPLPGNRDRDLPVLPPATPTPKPKPTATPKPALKVEAVTPLKP